MTVRTRGTSAILSGKAQSTHGTAATGNFQRLPFYSFGLVTTTPQNRSAVLSAGFSRSSPDSYQDVVTHAGPVVVPIDTGSFPFWMTALLGTGTDTGTSPVTTTWKSGGTIPDLSLERAFADISDYALFTDVKADTLDIAFKNSGEGQMTLGLKGCGRTDSGSTSAGTITTPATTLLKMRQFKVLLDGSPLPNVASGSLKYSNQLEEIRTVQNTALGQPTDLDLGQTMCNGQLVVRRTSPSTFDTAAHTLTFELDYTAAGITFYMPRVFFARPTSPINGPNGVESTVAFEVAMDGTSSADLTVTWQR